MTSLLHISDTHYKCICKKGSTCNCNCSDGWVGGLRKKIDRLKDSPKLLVHSGDLTAKSRRSEFAFANAQINYLKKSIPNSLVIPGNQDVHRHGLDYFEEYFGSPRQVVSTKKFFVVGVNSAESNLDVKNKKRMEKIRHYNHIAKIHRGFVGPEQYTWIRKQFRKAKPDQIKVFVLHHHLIHIPGTGINESMLIDDADVMQLLLDEGVDLVLAGHRHRSWYWEVRDEHKKMLRILHAGRLSSPSGKRSEDQGYNLISYKNKKIKIERYFLDKPRKKPEIIAEWKFEKI